jgi:hypothetical protein
MENKILIIIPWYGKIPIYFPLFLKGVEFNKHIIDVLFITESKINCGDKLPTNFKIKEISFSDYKLKLGEQLHHTLTFSNAYKLCDFKPMLGKLFEKELENYEFWGYGDIDLIFGDLKKFLSDENLKIYDIFTFREYIVSGAFTILRKNDYILNLYKKSKDLTKICLEDNYIAFDEAGLKIGECRKRIPAYKLIHLDNFECWTSIIHKEFHNGSLNLYSKYELVEFIRPSLIYNYIDGCIKLGVDEFVAYHFVTEKRSSKFSFKTKWNNNVPDRFTITNNGFYERININTKFSRLKRKIIGELKILKVRITDSINYRLK